MPESVRQKYQSNNWILLEVRVEPLQDFSKKTEEVSPEDDSTPETVTEVYYMSEEARKKSLGLTEMEAKGDLDAAEKIVDEMKQESKLIWSEQEDRNTASFMLK